jgi:methyl-accepting chemotaxis protein
VRAKDGEAREADKALVAVLAAAIVLLLFATNVQLWRLASRDEAGGQTAATARSALPSPVSGTSNDVLSEQMRRFTRRVTVPLNGLRSQLTGLQGLGRSQREVAAQIKGMNTSIRRLGGLRGEIGQMTDGLQKMIASTREMSNGLVAMGEDMSATRMSMDGMVNVMKRVEGGITATNASSREASSGIATMRDATVAMSQSFVATAAKSGESTASLDQHMGDLVELFCLAFNSSVPACVTSEAPAAAVVTPNPPMPLESSGESPFRQGLDQALPLGPTG